MAPEELTLCVCGPDSNGESRGFASRTDSNDIDSAYIVWGARRLYGDKQIPKGIHK